MSGTRARVLSLSLRNFRNFERLDLTFPEEGFALVGDNGQGKTNLLEAVYYLSLMRSARGARDSDLVRFGADSFFLDARIAVNETHSVAVGFERTGRRKRVRRDGAIVDRLSDALGALPVVMFAPDDVELVAGSPSARRRYLDIMLALTVPGYLRALQQYRAALERRNATLRDARGASGAGAATSAMLQVWEAPLASHGAVLLRCRREWTARVAERFATLCAAIGEAASVRISHQSGVDADAANLEQELARALAARRQSDLRYGLTQAGPHRDDLLLQLDDRDLRTFGSAGQQRTAAIALRMLEAETLRDARGASPVFLLDDPFAELDMARSARVLGLLAGIGLGQTVLAVPRDTDIPAELTALHRMRVASGRISA